MGSREETLAFVVDRAAPPGSVGQQCPWPGAEDRAGAEISGRGTVRLRGSTSDR
jgi:hypothetical protein